MFLKWKCRRVSVGISGTSLDPCCESLLVILAESPCLAERQFRTYILRIRSVPNHSRAIAVFLHQALERAQNVTRNVSLQADIFIRCLRVYVRVGRIVESSSGAEVKMVLIGILQKGIALEVLKECGVEVEYVDYAELRRIDLIIEP